MMRRALYSLPLTVTRLEPSSRARPLIWWLNGRTNRLPDNMEDDLDPEARHPFRQDPAAGAEQRAAGHDVVAGPHQALQGHMHSGHAGGRGAAGLGSLQQGQAVLEHLRRRIAEALVDEPWLLAGEPLIGRAGGVVGEALGEEERLGHLAIG